jgi:hypothetical protein
VELPSFEIMIDRGFGIFPSVFDPRELSAALIAATTAATRSKAGARHLLHLTAVRQLAEDSRLLKLASQFIGESPIPFKATWFDKPWTGSRTAHGWTGPTALCSPVV